MQEIHFNEYISSQLLIHVASWINIVLSFMMPKKTPYNKLD